VYKARCFPKCDFLHASLGHKPSYVWQSLCNSKFILKAGSRWRIEEGDDILVWNNNWIAGNITLILPSDDDFHMSNLWVSHCMLQDQNRWDIPFLEAIFYQQIVSHIINTPLYPCVKKDMLVWSKETNGDYSVRSAYHFSMQELLDTYAFKIPKKWDMIWKLKVPPKVKNFMWRLTRNVLPTRTRLRYKRVNCPGNCVLCNSTKENSLHLFFDFPSSCNIWYVANLSQAISNVTNQGGNGSNCIF